MILDSERYIQFNDHARRARGQVLGTSGEEKIKPTFSVKATYLQQEPGFYLFLAPRN